MKTVFNTENYKVMKNYMKFICAILMLLGTSAHAWGSCTLYGGVNGDVVIATIADDATLAGQYGSHNSPVTGWNQTIYWTTSKYGFSATKVNNSAATYRTDGQTPGGNSALYAVYESNSYGADKRYSGSPFVCYYLNLDPTSGSSYASANKYTFITAGTSITITAYPAEGAYVNEWMVENDNTHAAITPTSSTATTFVFTMPSSDVTALVDFASCTTPTVAFPSENVYKDKDASSFTKTATAKVGDDDTEQTITYTSSNTDVATVNSSTGEITMKGVVGSTTITATAEADEDYCEGTATYTLYAYTNPTVNNTNFAGVSRTPTSVTVRGGQVSNKGGLDITAYGYVVGTSSSVNWDTKVAAAGANGDPGLNTDFGTVTTTTDLTPGTHYYIRAFAYNGKAFGYSTYGEFTTPYEITLNKNGGDANGYAYVLPNGTTLTNISAPTKTGYEVEGYYTTSDFGAKVATDAGALSASITVSATEWTDGSNRWTRGAGETFYAKWTPAEYTVTFDKNGGSGGSDNVTATYNAAMPAATMPTTPPTGKTFDGYWYNSVKYYNADGSSAHVWDVADNVTLTASWTTATPTLAIASVGNVVISSTTPSLAEEASTTVTSGSTVTLSHGDPETGYYWLSWNVYETGNAGNTLTVTNNQFTMPSHNVTVSANLYTDMVFSCANWTITGPSGNIVFITSAANKTVRSQEKFRIQGDGLPANTELTFAISPSNSKFAIMKSDGTIPSTNEYGAVDADVYVFYTPDAGDTSDGLDEFTSLTVSVTGEPRTATIDTKRVIGRHIATDFVIAGKKNNKWYALPANMSSTTNPSPTEIAVDDIDNPSIAYTASTNIFNLYGQVSETISGEPGKLYTNGETVKLGMKNNASYPNYPLFGSATGTSTIGRGGTATSVTNNIGQQYWWVLTQTATSITNPQDAKYTIKCSNNTQTLSIKETPFQWGLYASGVEELRLIPASNIPYTEAYFVEWGQYGGVIEVDATGISATKVKATLNGNSSLVKALSQTLTSGKSRASIYNYTLNFNDLGNVIDFSAAASNGELLTLDWYNSSDVLVAKTTMVVPKIIASTSDMKTIMSGDAQWETEVHVLPGVTLTANGGSFESSDVRINLLEIYPGAVVKVTTGTLNVASLVLRNGWTRAGTKKFDVARLHIASTANLTKANNTDGWYSDWYVDYDQYYSISVPWEVTLANVKYRYCSVEPTVGGDDGNIRLRYYDGEQRASTAQSQIGKNWKDYGKTGNKAVPSKLLPSMGYAMNAKRPSGKAFSIIRMPMDFPGNEWTALGEKGEVSSVHKDQVTVTGWGYGTSTPWYAMGWNFIGNPYMCEFSGNDDGITGKMELQNGGSIRYATIPDEGFKNYDQVNIATEPLKPASGFFIQANSASEETITFNASKIVPPSSPERYMTQTEAIPEQEAYIRLSYEGGRDQMGLIIGEDYTAAYEVNADLAKVLGDAGYVKTYMRYADMDMAYLAINKTLAREWIPVTVILPTSGEYTYSLMSSSEVEHLEGVYLIDYTTNEITNLIENDYVFTATAGTISNRFAINATVGERQTPTEIDVIGADKNGDEPIKFLYHDKVFIWHHGVIYDATGKKVK